VTCPSETSVVRQAATFYISSLLARAQFVSPKMMRCMLAQMAEWCHLYVAAHEETSGCDVKSHAVFYAVCQGLFYVVAFRHADLVNSAKGLLWTQSLGLAKLVTSRLNPLKPCLPAVAQNFASVTRTYQIAYCFTVKFACKPISCLLSFQIKCFRSWRGMQGIISPSLTNLARRW